MPLRHIPGRVARLFRAKAGVSSAEHRDSYEARVAAEQLWFTQATAPSELPEIYHYWSNTFLRPRLASAGFDGPADMFEKKLAEAYDNAPCAARRFLSVGTGDCQTEIELAASLVRSGREAFVFECLELNPDLVARGEQLARQRGVADRISMFKVDVNQWSPAHEYDAVLANSSLHHIQNLEGLFDGIARSLLPSGTFMTSDTIGRNGHMRWPEALGIVESYWEELPEEYRFNHQLRRTEREFVNLDCSTEGFEGIRAQDILPLLIRHFDFDYFAAFANVIDPFIERSFGPNFSSSRDWDRAFIDRLEARDRTEILSGRIKPTHLIAAMCVDRPGKNVFVDGLSPQFCVRQPSRAPRIVLRPPPPPPHLRPPPRRSRMRARGPSTTPGRSTIRTYGGIRKKPDGASVSTTIPKADSSSRSGWVTTTRALPRGCPSCRGSG